MILNPAARVQILSGGNILWGFDHCTVLSAYPSLHSFGVVVVHWVPEQLNIKAVTGACKLINGCSLALCSATSSVVSSGICHRNEFNSTAWLYRDGPSHKLVSFTLHYIICKLSDVIKRVHSLLKKTWYYTIQYCSCPRILQTQNSMLI